MSDFPYPTRLVWDGRRGLAKHDDVVLVLRGPPNALPDISEIDYAPGIVAQIRPHDYDKMRDLEPIETVVLDRWLDDLAKWARRFLKLPKKKRP